MSLLARHTVDPADSVLSNRQFRLWEDMLENRTGVLIPQRQQYMRSEIAKRMVEGGWADADSYLRDILATANGAGEWGVLLDRLLVKETRFFRHQASYDYVRQRVAALASKPVCQEANSKTGLNIWSAGCATGEEAYSLAMSVAEGFANAGQEENYYLVGSDVSTAAITVARKGIYPGGSFGAVAPMLRKKYFSEPELGNLKIIPAVRRRVALVVANLLEKQVRYRDQMDLIFCQNVLVYFKHWRRRELVNYFRDCLKPGACLIVGPGELRDWRPENRERIDVPGIQAYEKTA